MIGIRVFIVFRLNHMGLLILDHIDLKTAISYDATFYLSLILCVFEFLFKQQQKVSVYL